ncbi:MAG TPA: hypothetical protein VJ553_03970 [Candidatus Paceibacterota bacterium]|nr:hypothetical protein [Candidatus Paceibacterota bacterium]
MVQRFLNGLASHKLVVGIGFIILFILGLIAYALLNASNTMTRAVRDDEDDRMR